MSELKADKTFVFGEECEAYKKSEADKFIADLEESHKKEVGQLLMKIAGLEKLVETANKLIKQNPESRVSWADAESSIKRHNAKSKDYADNVLMEEMAEACSAIGTGDKDHAKQELAQVCAVAIRMMHRLDVNG